jgi:predicted transcriptional regulator
MSNDDILNARIQRDLQNKDNLNLPREALGRKIMKHIMNILISFQNEGMHHSQLVEYIGIDRKTLRRYMKRLIKMDLVTREPGRQGKYFPTTKRHRGSSISANILAESFIEKFLRYDVFVPDSPYFKRRIPYVESELEDALFNFSNIIGGWITYILIQSMNPANKLTDYTKDITEKDLIMQSWIEDAISLIQPHLLFSFQYYIGPFLETFLRANKGKDIFNDQKSINEFVSELNDAFSNLYPNLSCELEKTRAELPILERGVIDEIVVAVNTILF